MAHDLKQNEKARRTADRTVSEWPRNGPEMTDIRRPSNLSFPSMCRDIGWPLSRFTTGVLCSGPWDVDLGIVQ